MESTENSVAIVKKSDLKARVITASGLVIVIGLFCYFATNFYWARSLLLVLAFALSLFAIIEFVIFSRHSATGSFSGIVKSFGIILCFTIPVLVTFLHFFFPMITAQSDGLRIAIGTYGSGLILTFIAYLLSLWAIISLIIFSDRESMGTVELAFRELIIAHLLLALGGSFLVSLAALPGAPLIIVWFLLLICSSDIGAYFVGRKVGGVKLAPAISPNKTISGSIAGLVFGLLVSLLSIKLLPFDLGLFHSIALSLLLIIVSQVGDLLQSYLKRLANVKDSSSFLPGHGGIFDRIDAIIAAVPLYYLFILYYLYF
jgi:CDP-diglyceride synthetase